MTRKRSKSSGHSTQLAFLSLLALVRLQHEIPVCKTIPMYSGHCTPMSLHTHVIAHPCHCRPAVVTGRPDDSGISLAVVKELGPDIPVFGVCMGHQCIGQSFGGNIIRAPCGVMHGKTSDVFHTNTGLLEVRTRMYVL